MTATKEQNNALNTGGTRNALQLAEALDAGCFNFTSSIAA